MNEPTTYICKCGTNCETGIGHRFGQCSEEWRICYKCAFCKIEVWNGVIGPNYNKPTIQTIHNHIVCDYCLEFAIKALIDKFK